jgi:hypothetical protein
MFGDIVKGIFGDKIGGMFGSLFDIASLFVPQLAMIKTLDMIADTIKEGPEGLTKLPQLLSQLGLPTGIASQLPSIVSELAKGDQASVLALPRLLRSFGIETPEVLGEVTNALDSNQAIRSLLPGVLQNLGVPTELSSSITRLVDTVSENNAQIRAARETQNIGGDIPAADNVTGEGGVEILNDIIDSDADIRTRYGIPA